MSNRIERAMEFAMQEHGACGHMYGNEPYWVHLVDVVEVLHEYKHLFNPDHFEQLLAAAPLHDVLEDCPSVSYKDLETQFGPDVARLVYAVTKAPMSSWKLVNAALGAKLRDCPDALPLKLADRIANMRKGEKNDMYIKRFPNFYENLRDISDQYDEMWTELKLICERDTETNG